MLARSTRPLLAATRRAAAHPAAFAPSWAAASAASAAAPAAPPSRSSSSSSPSTLITGHEGVHQTMKVSKDWRNKPLFRRQGDVRFKTGLEAANLLVAEAKRRDAHETSYIENVEGIMSCLAPVFERNPRYAFIAKQLMEPERYLQFRVAWIDDVGVVRTNRGYRIQYSSSMGPYEGAIHFGHHINSDVVKSLGFGSVFSNAVTGFDVGAAVGGADINPYDKSEAEIQRFCQSYMTELAKYVGPDVDQPTLGMGIGEKEVGYLFGQYKRIAVKSSSGGNPFLSARNVKAPGFGIVHFANAMLRDRGDTLEGKRCLILGSGKVARAVAQKLLEYGAIPVGFSDSSGHVYEPDGFDVGKLATINKIKDERGALLGRYIISSTTARFNDPHDPLDIECDLCFPCAGSTDMGNVGEAEVDRLADGGCRGLIEGGHAAVTPGGRKALKKRGLMYGPHTMSLTGNSIAYALGKNATDARIAEEVGRIYTDCKLTAQEFNARGDLYAGSHLAGFLRVANVMLNHGAV